ncbi:MAG: FAD-dependent monooxygenase [Flavobacteriaceae bacterium]|nr:MAG: FAD-dependent monooxygenase [Flavobacteriaceae bacterium]
MNFHPQKQICPKCQGEGKRAQRISKKKRLLYQKALESFKAHSAGEEPPKPKAKTSVCIFCKGTGLLDCSDLNLGENNIEKTKESLDFPKVAIVGAGIGGMALAVALFHRGIPFEIFEKDNHFSSRSQGYGLTLQQASRALGGFGIEKLKNGVVSTRHLVLNPTGEVLGQWGYRKWLKEEDTEENHKKSNIHIARQSLREELMFELGGESQIQWGHQLVFMKQNPHTKQMELHFLQNGNTKITTADLVIGADGIRSKVRELWLENQSKKPQKPLRYLGCLVVLGICDLQGLVHPFLDGATVFQTANGIDRIYLMPYDKNSLMWQLSFPISEEKALEISQNGAEALKNIALEKTHLWHEPIGEILQNTPLNLISGYPVYDRELLEPKDLDSLEQTTLLGDAAHPMSPFKGQGANQALLDALSLARIIYKQKDHWKKTSVREAILQPFEAEMLLRSAKKVKDSARAVDILHSEVVLTKADRPRGKIL